MKLHRIQIEPIVRAALLEDLGGFGDRTSAAVVPENTQVRAAFVAREAGILCGLEVARICFDMLNPALRWSAQKNDSDKIATGEQLALVEGSATDILAAERVALNFLSHLCGIATLTGQMVGLAGSAKVYCTRKTTPNLRLLEKYAVHCGGGANHRFNLGDSILIKDNHIALAPSIADAVARARRSAGPLATIEVEADTLAQVEEVIASGADAVLLDNMSPDELRQAVKLVGGRLVTDASGRITLDNIKAVAASGVDIISSGSLTHSAKILDIGLDFKEVQ